MQAPRYSAPAHSMRCCFSTAGVCLAAACGAPDEYLPLPLSAQYPKRRRAPARPGGDHPGAAEPGSAAGDARGGAGSTRGADARGDAGLIHEPGAAGEGAHGAAGAAWEPSGGAHASLAAGFGSLAGDARGGASAAWDASDSGAGDAPGLRAVRRVADALHAAGLDGSLSPPSSDGCAEAGTGRGGNGEKGDRGVGAEAAPPAARAGSFGGAETGLREFTSGKRARTQSLADITHATGEAPGSAPQATQGSSLKTLDTPTENPFDYAAARAAAPGLDLAAGMAAAARQYPGRSPGRGRGRRGDGAGRGLGRGADRGRGRGARGEGAAAGLGGDARKRKPAFNPYDIPDEGLLKGGKRSTVMPRSGNRSAQLTWEL